VSGLLEMLEAASLVESRSEARRLVSQRAVQVDGERVTDATVRLPAGSYLVKVGKRRFARIIVG
jgi:tyrosyl-tRNA synthetase